MPPDFADVLKAYTKEVIRRQPEDILEFSVAYFANLANIGRTLDEVVPPTYDQLKIVYATTESRASCSVEELLEVCSQAGISSHHVVDVIAAAGLETGAVEGGGGVVNPNVVLMLLLSTTSYSLSAVIASIFQALGTDEQLSKEEFLKLFAHLVDADKYVRTPPTTKP